MFSIQGQTLHDEMFRKTFFRSMICKDVDLKNRNIKNYLERIYQGLLVEGSVSYSNLDREAS